MYPNLYYIFKDWFGVEWHRLRYLHTFGLMVAIAFLVAAWILTLELKRKEKQALLLPREETITVGKPATWWDLLLSALTGFLFGYKLLGLLFSKPDDVDPQQYIFSAAGSWVAGLLTAVVLAALKWWEKNKQSSREPETRSVRIWPHDRVGDIVVIALITGIIGAKFFDAFENWDDFVRDPLARLFSAGGLTFYGGLLVAAVAVAFYAVRKNIRLVHLVDAAAPALMIAYAVGRIGCQISGDGDWGIYNSAYLTDADGKSVPAQVQEYEARLKQYETYFLRGAVADPGKATLTQVTDRIYPSLEAVPHRALTAPGFLPVWVVAYAYPRNVNNDGIVLAAVEEDHNRALPLPVFPTPLYETVLCTLLFLVLWGIRKQIKTAGMLTGIYLVMNGAERFLIEQIRVNNQLHWLGMKITQAELIASGLMLAGVLVMIWAKSRRPQSSEA